ncbi:MAG TPA: DoxX family protein [Thermoanaerobaculia bacterium]|nr:DoxX family protein [Thermoanaerobaculia bacterium]
MAVAQFTYAWAPRIRSLLRLVAGLMFLLHGTQKLMAFPDASSGGGAPETMSKMWIAGVLELVLGALIAIGLFTRLAAFLASGEMAVAYFTVHAPNSIWPSINQGELAALYCWVFFYFAFAGPGPWAVDALFGKRAAT